MCTIIESTKFYIIKLSFLSELEMLKQHHKGFHYTFVKLDYGPFSSELRNDLGNLIQQQFLNEGLRPTDKAHWVLEDFKEYQASHKAELKELREQNQREHKEIIDQIKLNGNNRR